MPLPRGSGMIRRQLYERGIWWHGLDNKKEGDGHNRAWVDRQGWLHWPASCASFQFLLGPGLLHWFGVSFTADPGGDDDLSFYLALPLFALYLNLDCPTASRLVRHLIPAGYEERVIEFQVRSGYMGPECRGEMTWRLWSPDSSWSSRTPRWRDGSWSPIDALLGQEKYSSRVLSTHQAEIVFPEGGYSATIELFESTWKRPRWPRPKVIRRAKVEMHKPVPIPGKGENAWDIEDDAIYSMTCPAATVEEAIGHLRASVERDRKRYGGDDWRPEN